MRICYVTPSYPHEGSRGGAGVYTQELAQGITRLGHEAHVVCVSDEITGDEQDAGIHVHFVPPKRLRIRRILQWLSRLPFLHRLAEVRCGWGLVENSLGAWLAVARLHRQKPFDLIVALNLDGIALFGLLWPWRRVPIVISGHSFIDLQLDEMQWPGAEFHCFLEQFCLRRADHVMPNSEYLAHVYRSRFGVLADRISVVYQGFHLPDTGSEGEDSRLAIPAWDAGDTVVFYVGRLEQFKGCDVLFRAWEQAHQDQPNLRLLLAGSVTPSFAAEYDAFMAQNKPWVFHAGVVSADELSRLMRLSSMLVLPSRHETFGRVLVEAQLHKVPVIGANTGGIPEIIQHGETGLLVEPNDVDGLADTILQLARDEVLRRSLAEQGWAVATSRFGFSKSLDEHLACYARIVRAFAVRKFERV
ncbi:MAG: glycosyltransferase family 4 protein [Chloroflexi bacterium]|nr:glycosyltransferase family 4 protein [Chloroflexota bacterium]